jgi:hypothetical protein
MISTKLNIIIKVILVLALTAFYLNLFGQNLERSGKSDLEVKVESYIIDQIQPKYYYSIEFGPIEVFDLHPLINAYEFPTIFYDEPIAIKENKEVFTWLQEFTMDYDIAYSMKFLFGTKEQESEAWTPYWSIVLIDNNFNIIEYLTYHP